MSIDESAIVEIVRRTLDVEQLAGATVLWDRTIRPAGEKVRIGVRDERMPFDGTLVFVDLAPMANWAHPCVYLLVSDDATKTHRVQASFPPFRGGPPDSYIEVLRHGETTDRAHQDRPHGEEKGDES